MPNGRSVLRSGAIILFRGQLLDIDFFAYIKCDELGLRRIHDDYDSGKGRPPEEYGEVIYRAPMTEPDQTAERFLKEYVLQNNYL